ncbi:glycosyltransferase 87 family protein [Streptomyces diastatochromogenes]|nr:glycosyltransferase 87 family protein [Streptomyces diastatochromogenes]
MRRSGPLARLRGGLHPDQPPLVHTVYPRPASCTSSSSTPSHRTGSATGPPDGWRRPRRGHHAGAAADPPPPGDPRTAAYWAWCPAVPVEAVNNAHVDGLAVLLSVTALGLTVRHRAGGGALLGLAIAVKLLPAVLLPGALSGVRRARDAAAVLLPAAAVLTALYAPYVLLSRSSVLGYLGGYADEEGYQDASAGNRYALLRLLLPDAWALPAVLVGALAVSLYVIRRGDPRRPWSGALLVTGTAFLLTTPGYSWYALLLIALVALDGRWEWLGVAVAGAVAYLTGPTWADAGTVLYSVAALAVLCGWAARDVPAFRPRGRPCPARRGAPRPLESGTTPERPHEHERRRDTRPRRPRTYGTGPRRRRPGAYGHGTGPRRRQPGAYGHGPRRGRWRPGAYGHCP